MLLCTFADPFVSQTVFQGFSCRQLDEHEKWLDVDFQISCTSNSYLAFVSLGFVGVLVYPLGLPTCMLLLLFKNGGEIKSGGAAYERYEFLVAGDIDVPPESPLGTIVVSFVPFVTLHVPWSCAHRLQACLLLVGLP